MAYIEREKAIEVIKNFAKAAISDGQKALDPVDDIVMLCRAVDMIPAADVEEVKHGEWIYHECVASHEGTISGYSCSVCSAAVDEDVFDTDEFHKNHCGYCGAKMGGNVKNTEHFVDVNKMVQNQWISVNEQVPETYIEVLVCFKSDGSNVIAFVNRFGKWKNACTDNFIESEITHWMPLPEPPKGVIKNENKKDNCTL